MIAAIGSDKFGAANCACICCLAVKKKRRIAAAFSRARWKSA